MENLPEIVGTNLQALRKAKGLTQQELSAQVHYSDKSISKWELGYALPSVDILLDFATYFGVTLDFLVAEHEQGEVAKQEEAKQRKTDPNPPIIMAMSVTFVILVAICIFFSRFLFAGEDADQLAFWPVFVWMVPFTFLLLAVETQLFYHKSIATLTLASIALWTFIASFPIAFSRPDLWMILVVGGPIQVIFILYRNLRKKRT